MDNHIENGLTHSSVALDNDSLAKLVKNARDALLVGDIPEMERLLAQVQPHLRSRGVVLDAIRDQQLRPIDLGIVVVPSRFKGDWKSAIPSLFIMLVVAAIVVLHEDGRLVVVKNRFGPTGLIQTGVPPFRLPSIESGLCDPKVLAYAATDTLQALYL
jgi:hypothetical protein